jgi:hypothetical protein
MTGRFAQATWEAVAVATLAVVLVAGSAFVWIGIPLLGLWIAGMLAETPERFLLIALCSIPTAMVLFGWVLHRVNRVYERLHPSRRSATGPRSAWLRSSTDERGRLRRARRPRTLFEASMVASAWTALVLMAIWFFFFAEMRLVSP